MKINDLAGNKIVVYDSSLERFSRFCRRLEKLGYIWNIENNHDDVIYRPCVFITSNHRIFVCEILLKIIFLLFPRCHLMILQNMNVDTKANRRKK